jgi:hypothetical protein
VKKDEKRGRDMFKEVFGHLSAGTEGDLENLYWGRRSLKLATKNRILDLIDKENSAATQMRYLVEMEKCMKCEYMWIKMLYHVLAFDCEKKPNKPFLQGRRLIRLRTEMRSSRIIMNYCHTNLLADNLDLYFRLASRQS